MSSTVNSSNLSLDKRSLIHNQKMSSEIDHLEMDPSQFYFANDPRHPQNIPLQPMFKQRQISQGIQGNITRAPISPSRSVDFAPFNQTESQPPEKQYHFLPGDDSELTRSDTMPSSMGEQYPGPQPPPRYNMGGPAPSMGHNLLPFANSTKTKQPKFIDPLDKRTQQTFSTFLEDKHYETLEKRSAVKDTPPSSLVSFPSSKPLMVDVKNMKVEDDDTIVRQITVTKKKKKYPIHCLLFLCQLFTIVLVLAVAGVAVVALLEVKKLEDLPTTQVQYSALESQITNLTDTISILQSRITTLNEQLSQTETSLDERVMLVEDERMELTSQFQNLSASTNESIGPCVDTTKTCRAGVGSSCVPSEISALTVLEVSR
eukprot:TRINITY_DN550_c0_g1_i1.p1 TRINITY_DN550_c0_g1~~TRINITY_DN550_c0_g1_i1.p1  ORF type:complete len:373 (+),score=81.17 TRINITY_DN550_c0_g1_i1:212-1330(+)